MTVAAHQNDGLELLIASILDATQAAIEQNVLLPAFTGTEFGVSNIKWLGETEETAINGGPFVIDVGDAVDIPIVPVPVPVPEPEPDATETVVLVENTSDDSGIPVVVAVSIPLIVLVAFAFLLAKKNGKRNIMTANQYLDQGGYCNMVGTGDPPRSFHEGLYHYTRSGARYLSTNCEHCHETRRNGFFTEEDLATINEGQLYDPESPPSDSNSYCSEESCEPADVFSADWTLVSPSSKNLGGRHSGMDVHNCSSATCKICNPQRNDLAFATPPSSTSVQMQGDAMDLNTASTFVRGNVQPSPRGNEESSPGERCVV
jgi:hypothetical protein